LGILIQVGVPLRIHGQVVFRKVALVADGVNISGEDQVVSSDFTFGFPVFKILGEEKGV
jgi:hypothetical protein